MVAGVMDGFAMSSLLQLNYSTKNDAIVPYDGPASCGYALTLGITVRRSRPAVRVVHAAGTVFCREPKLPRLAQLPSAETGKAAMRQPKVLWPLL